MSKLRRISLKVYIMARSQSASEMENDGANLDTYKIKTELNWASVGVVLCSATNGGEEELLTL